MSIESPDMSIDDRLRRFATAVADRAKTVVVVQRAFDAFASEYEALRRDGLTVKQICDALEAAGLRGSTGMPVDEQYLTSVARRARLKARESNRGQGTGSPREIGSRPIGREVIGSGEVVAESNSRLGASGSRKVSVDEVFKPKSPARPFAGSGKQQSLTDEMKARQRNKSE